MAPIPECQVCLEGFNTRLRVPRTLRCRHYFCTSCLSQLLRLGALRCPLCRAPHPDPVVTLADLPVHLDVVDVLLQSTEREDDSLDVFRLRRVVEENDVWAVIRNNDVTSNDVMGSNDVIRCARLSVHRGRIHLHALRDGSPPEGVKTIEHHSLTPLLDNPSVFLEISWNDRPRGRIYIKLLDTEGRTQQFKSLCVGDKGPSYLNTRFFEVTSRGQPGEQLWGGDYERNDGTGGSALPGFERGAENRQDVVRGLVAGYYYTGFGQDHQPAQFGISTRDLVGYEEMSSIGRVMEGMDVVDAVVGLDDVQVASIGECGVVLQY